MKSYLYLLPILSLALVFNNCGSSSTADDSSDGPTISIVMQDENGTAGSLSPFLKAATFAECNGGEDGGGYDNLKCITPSNYTVGLIKIEFVSCDGDCVEADGGITNADTYETLYENSDVYDTDLTTGATLSSDDLETVDAGTYGGLRFTITYLQQTLPEGEFSFEGLSGALTYRICTMDGGCPAAADSESGDIMVDTDGDGTYEWMDSDNMGAPTTTRPANPAQQDFFATISGVDGTPETGFLATMANDAGAQTVAAGSTYELVATFTIGGAFRFDDDDDDDTFDPEDGEDGEPGKPASIDMELNEAT